MYFVQYCRKTHENDSLLHKNDFMKTSLSLKIKKGIILHNLLLLALNFENIKFFERNQFSYISSEHLHKQNEVTSLQKRAKYIVQRATVYLELRKKSDLKKKCVFRTISSG